MAKRGSILALLAILLLVTTAWAVGKTLTVQVREVQMRTAASFTSGLASTLHYGQVVSVLETKGSWYQVDSGSGKGWVQQSALTDQRLGLSAGGQDVAAGVGDREVTMAGKGFNSQTEQAYRADHPGGYAKVEEMLQINYPPDVLAAFLKTGQTGARQGVAQ